MGQVRVGQEIGLKEILQKVIAEIILRGRMKGGLWRTGKWHALRDKAGERRLF